MDVINQTWSPMYGKHQTASPIPDYLNIGINNSAVSLATLARRTELLNIFEVFLPQLLRYPNPSDPLNGEAAALLMRDPEAYNKRVKEYVERYAKAEDAAKAGVDGKGGNESESGSGSGSESGEDGEMSDMGEMSDNEGEIVGRMDA